MNKSPTCSVIIPVYNEPYYLEKCLESLLLQVPKIHQIIVVDNNSSDQGIADAQKKFKAEPSVEFIDESEQGIVFARNTGFSHASGDIFIKIDADTSVLPGWHAEILSDMQKPGVSAWSGYGESVEMKPWIVPVMRSIFNFHAFKVNKILVGGGMTFGSNMAIRREAWDVIRSEACMSNRIWEDLDLACLLQKNGLNVYVSKKILARISTRSANTTWRQFYRRLFGQTRVFMHHKRYISVVVSFFLVHIMLVTWATTGAFGRSSAYLSKRPRPDQY